MRKTEGEWGEDFGKICRRVMGVVSIPISLMVLCFCSLCFVVGSVFLFLFSW